MIDSLSFHRIKDVEIVTHADEKWMDLVIRNDEDNSFCFSLFAESAEDKNLLLEKLRDEAMTALLWHRRASIALDEANNDQT